MAHWPGFGLACLPEDQVQMHPASGHLIRALLGKA
jgi:hypothetical protein